MLKENLEKDSRLLERRFIELSRTAYQREIITYSDFLNLNEQNILHTLPKDSLFSRYISFGGYALAERQMAAFIPDALYLRWGKNELSWEATGYPFSAVKVTPRARKFAEDLSHRDYLGAVLNLGIERSRIGDILITDGEAIIFAHNDIADLITDELSRVRHTMVVSEKLPLSQVDYTPEYEEIRGTVASVRLDTLLPLAFSSSRSRLSGLIEGAKVFVNGKLITNNGYQVHEGDIISVRGMGKFRYDGAGGKTRKNRISVIIQKYI